MCRPVVVTHCMNWIGKLVEESSVAKMCGYCRNICKKLEMADRGIVMVDINAAQIVDMRPPKTLCSARNAARDYDIDCDNYAIKLSKCRDFISGIKESICMWKIKQIAEADFGCEERLPGEKLKCLVILENENGETRRLEVEDEWLTKQGLDEGSTWDIAAEKFI